VKTPVIFIILIFCAVTLHAQQMITLKQPAEYVAADRPGDFYIIDSSNKITKYNAQGQVIAASALDALPVLFDPWSGVRLFTYYPSKREIQYLNPSLELVSVLTIDSAFAIEPVLACPSGEYNYWVYDQADRSIKKINPRENKVQTEVLIGDYLSGQEAVLTIREYLNYFFILDREKGILIFNTLGIFVKQLPAAAQFFNFYGEELYYPENNKIIFFDLYSGGISEIQITEPFENMILLENKKVSIRERAVTITDFQR